MNISVLIGTLDRDAVLIETIRALLALEYRPFETLVVDQSLHHTPEAMAALEDWRRDGTVRWFRRRPPSTVAALNFGLREARGEIVLILDDDIMPRGELIRAHAQAFESFPTAWAVAGQVLQPGEEPEHLEPLGPRQGLRADLDFPFRSSRGDWVANAMAGNLSVRRVEALRLGGFDTHFKPPVAYRFETEFARRLIAAGGHIRFEPRASVRHLRAASGGTRTRGSHLTSAAPTHGVGDYYFAWRHGRGWERWAYLAARPLREVRTRFHARHPWWIPVKFVGELRALGLAWRLWRSGRRSHGANTETVSEKRHALFLYSARKQDGNWGDCVINRELLRLARQSGVLCTFVEGASASFLDTIGLQPGERTGRAALMAAAWQARWRGRPVVVLLTPGGDNDRMHWRFRREIRDALFWVLCRLAGCRLAHIGVSFSPPTPARDRWERWVRPQRLKQVLAVRDSASLAQAVRWGARGAVQLPDLAFLADAPAPVPATPPERPFVVLSFRHDPYPPFMDRLWQALDAIACWSEHATIRTVRLVWHAREDRAACDAVARRIGARFEVSVQHEEPTPARLASDYRNATLVFSNRLHVLLLAWIHGGLPVAVGDETFNRKLVRLFADQGFDELVLDTTPPGLAAEAVAARLDRIVASRVRWLERLALRSAEFRRIIHAYFEGEIACPSDWRS